MLTKQLLAASLLIGAAIGFAFPSSATAGKLLDQTGGSCFCPACDHCCKLEVEEVEEERVCYEIETKTICIPRVVFPWQRAKKKQSCASCDSCEGRGCTACVHNGARVRKVCVFKPKKYTCPACKYTWTPEKKDCCGGPGCGPACDDGCACDSAVTSHQPTPVEFHPAMQQAVQPVPAEPPVSAGAEYDFETPAPVAIEPVPVQPGR